MENWYGVKLLYINNVVGDPQTDLKDDNYIHNYVAYEESIIVVYADSFDSAYSKAEDIAKEDEDDYQNIYGQTIQVRLYDSIDCFLISDDKGFELKDGLEVYSRLIESNREQRQEDFLKSIFPISDGPKYMLLNMEFSRSN